MTDPMPDDRLAEIRRFLAVMNGPTETEAEHYAVIYIADLLAEVDRLTRELAEAQGKVARVEASVAEQTRYAEVELSHASGSFEDRLQGRMTALGELRAALSGGAS